MRRLFWQELLHRWRLVCEGADMKKTVIILFAALLGLSWLTALSEAADDPRELKAHLERAAALEEKGIYVDAIAEYESALEYAPDNEEIRVKMAQSYLNIGDSRNFISICEETAEQYQDNTKALDLLMEYYTENDREDDAVQYLAGFIETYPDNENAKKWFLELKGSYTELYCRYTEISDIFNDTIVVSTEELYGISDAKGNELIPVEYEEADPFSMDGFALVRKTDGEWIYIDEDGLTRKVPDKEYGNLGMFSEERATASKDSKFGYLDGDMEPVGKFVWDGLTGIRNGTGAGLSNGKWVLVDDEGKTRDNDQYDDVIIDENGFCSEQKRIFVKDGESYYIVNTKGKQIGTLTFENAKAFTEQGDAAVCIDGKWGFVNVDGEITVKCKYEDAQSFQNGYAAVCVDGKWGYIDEDGNMVIDPVFIEATHFSSQGTAAVKMNVQGEEVWRLIQLDLFQ